MSRPREPAARRRAGELQEWQWPEAVQPVIDQVQPVLSALPKLIPSPALILRSLALGLVVLTCLTTSIASWLVFYNRASVSGLGGRERVWLQFGHFQAPYANVPLYEQKYELRNLRYDVSLDLVVPAIERNLDLGNFMVDLSVISTTGQPLLNASRPASLVYPAAPSLLSLMSPSSVLSYVLRQHTIKPADTQRLHIKLLDNSFLSSGRRQGTPSHIFLRVGRDDAHAEAPVPALAGGAAGLTSTDVQSVFRCGPGSTWSGGRGELQVYESWLRLDARLSGLKYLLYYHPVLCFLAFVTVFTSLELFGALVAWAVWASRSGPSEGTRSGGTFKAGYRSTRAPSSIESAEQKSVLTGLRTRVKREDEDEDEDEDENGLIGSSGEEEERTTVTSGREPAATTVTGESSGTSTSMFERVDREAALAAEEERQRRLRGLAGIVGMVDVPGGEGEDEDGRDELEETTTEGETEEASSWEGVEEEAEDAGDKGGDEGTVSGSATTRATRTTFGPSVAATSSSARTGSSLATGLSEGAVLRERRRAEQERRLERGGDQSRDSG